MEDLIDIWKGLRLPSKIKWRQDIKRLTLKRNRSIDAQADKVHKEVFKKIDCLDCASCCKTLPPMLVPTDIKRIAKHLGMKEKAFSNEYLTKDEDEDKVLNSSPCTFLDDDNSCSIYEVRPRACRQYPHTDQGEFSQNASLHVDNVFTCPAVYHIIERLKEVVVK